MIRRLSILILCLFLGALVTAAQNAPSNGILVDVGDSDTLASIAERTGKPEDCLRRANGLVLSTSLEGRTRLFIPDDCATLGVAETSADQGGGETAATEVPAGTISDQSYVVQRGDRLAKIAEDFGVTLQCVVESNGIADPNLIYPGQILLITTACQGAGGGAAGEVTTTTPARACRFDRNAGRSALGNLYTVQAGDTLDFIACDFNLDLSCLVAANPVITNRGLLAIGQELVIDRTCAPWTDSTLPR